MTTSTLQVLKSNHRGRSQSDWLESRHSFSFDQYYNQQYINFSDLRVINEDWVQPNTGFGMHPHRDMEIITYVLDGALEHQDSLGNHFIIRPGEIQRMTAGSGIRHSEVNPSNDRPVHLLQIWILPSEQGLTPGYEQKTLVDKSRRDVWQLVASPDAEGDSMLIHQDVRLYAAVLSQNGRLEYNLTPNRAVWFQVARGEIRLNGQILEAGDGAAVEQADFLSLEGVSSESEVLLFDLRGK